MLVTKVIALAVAGTTPTTGVEMDVTPNLPGTSACIMLHYKTAADAVIVIEGSDNNSDWSSLYAPGDIDVTDLHMTVISPSVILPKYVRVNASAFVGGTVDAYVLNAN